MDLLEIRPQGLYCTVGNFFIDPSRIVQTAIITHAHSDHGSTGHKTTITHPITAALLNTRYTVRGEIIPLSYGHIKMINDVAVSLHPAGHVPGSAQIRISYKGETWVVSGDYKRVDDGVSTPFEVVPCDVFITESTFGLPQFRWEKEETVYDAIDMWWKENQKKGKTSLLLGYSLGKAQRLLAKLNRKTGPIWVHESIATINETLRDQGVSIPETQTFTPTSDIQEKTLVVAPPASMRGTWMKRIGPFSIGYVSGWMMGNSAPWYIRTNAKFALSDHADFPGLLETVADTGATRVLTMHGYAKEFSAYLTSMGISSNYLPL